MMDLARESVWWEPLDHRIGVDERAVDSVGCGPQHSMKLNGVRHDLLLNGTHRAIFILNVRPATLV
jgi:hypothetical protein